LPVNAQSSLTSRVQGGVLDVDVVSQFEATFERASGYTAMQMFAILCLGRQSLDDQHIAFLDNDEKTRDRHFDAVVVVARFNDVVGWPRIERLQPLGVVQKVEHAVKADTGAMKWCKIKIVSHSQILGKVRWNGDAETRVTGCASPKFRENSLSRFS